MFINQSTDFSKTSYSKICTVWLNLMTMEGIQREAHVEEPGKSTACHVIMEDGSSAFSETYNL